MVFQISHAWQYFHQKWKYEVICDSVLDMDYLGQAYEYEFGMGCDGNVKLNERGEKLIFTLGIKSLSIQGKFNIYANTPSNLVNLLFC